MNDLQTTRNLRKVAYFGSPDFSASLLSQILKNQQKLGVQVALVFTQPDKPAGRKMQLRQTPVKELALRADIPVFDKPFKQNISEIVSSLQQNNVDLALLFAFNEIIPREVLTVPTLGFWNVHPSLLPQYRGPSPVSFPLILGDTQTGVTLTQMDAKMDTGDVISQITYPIEFKNTQETVLAGVPHRAYELIEKGLANTDDLVRAKQNDTHATYTRKLKREDGYVAWNVMQKLLNAQHVAGSLPIIEWYRQRNPSYTPPEYTTLEQLFNLWRGLHPWPGVWTEVMIGSESKRLKIIEMEHEDESFHITKVQLEGRQVVSFQEFTASFPQKQNSK